MSLLPVVVPLSFYSIIVSSISENLISIGLNSHICIDIMLIRGQLPFYFHLNQLWIGNSLSLSFSCEFCNFAIWLYVCRFWDFFSLCNWFHNLLQVVCLFCFFFFFKKKRSLCKFVSKNRFERFVSFYSIVVNYLWRERIAKSIIELNRIENL